MQLHARILRFRWSVGLRIYRLLPSCAGIIGVSQPRVAEVKYGERIGLFGFPDDD